MKYIILTFAFYEHQADDAKMNNQALLAAAVSAIEDCEIARKDELRGCSDREIAQLELDLGIQLPCVYREFLLRMGRSAGGLFVGSDAFFPKLRRLQTWASEMLSEVKSPFILPTDAFVILMHQGYVCFFIRTMDGDDPPVYRILERDTQATLVSATFSAFLLDMIRECCEMKKAGHEYRREHGLADDC